MNTLKVEYVDHMGTALTVVNAARVSFGNTKTELDDKDKKLIKYLADHQHMSPFEHCSLTVKITCPLYIRSQIHRHRTFCLSGDSEITFNRPDKWKKGIHVKQSGNKGKKFTMTRLFSLWNNPKHRGKLESMLIRCYDEKNDRFTVSNLTDVLYSGKKLVFELETESGKKLKCTKDHKILTHLGWQRLEDAVGLELSKNNVATITKDSYVITNGEFAYKNRDWLATKKSLGYSVQDLANEAGCSYHTIRKWLKIFNLQYDQIQTLKDYKQKHGAWNKGKRYKTGRIVTDEHKKIVSEARRGSKSNFWKGGITSNRKLIAAWTTSVAPTIHKKFNYTCQSCGKVGEALEAHHIVPVSENESLAYSIENLTSLCKSCHRVAHKKNAITWRAKSKGNTLVGRKEKIVSVTYVGEEDTYDLSVKGPNHNFVANGMVVHNSYNEVSRRYTEKNMEFYLPDEYRKQHKSNRQASEGALAEEHQQALKIEVAEHHAQSLKLYEDMLAMGVCKEQARGVLPQDLVTEFYMTGNLRNWAHFVKLRDHEGAQYEVQLLAQQVREVLISKFGYPAEVLCEK